MDTCRRRRRRSCIATRTSWEALRSSVGREYRFSRSSTTWKAERRSTSFRRSRRNRRSPRWTWPAITCQAAQAWLHGHEQERLQGCARTVRRSASDLTVRRCSAILSALLGAVGPSRDNGSRSNTVPGPGGGGATMRDEGPASQQDEERGLERPRIMETSPPVQATLKNTLKTVLAGPRRENLALPAAKALEAATVSRSDQHSTPVPARPEVGAPLPQTVGGRAYPYEQVRRA